MKQRGLIIGLLVVLAGTAGAGQQGQTGGPIPDRRHFNGSVGIPEAVRRWSGSPGRLPGTCMCLPAPAETS